MFANKFSSVSGSSEEGRNSEYLPSLICAQVSTPHRLDSSYVRRAVGKLSTGLGFDGIHSNHFKFASEELLDILSQFFNSCLIHSHIKK